MVLMPGLKGKYDAWNRLVEVRDSNDNLIAQYEYNGLNQRIKKTVNNIETKSFFNENWQELESITNNQVTNYIWGLRYIDDLILREKGEERLYSFADPNWNVVAICDDFCNVQERYTYDAFGKRNIFNADFTAKTGTNFDWNRVFTGQVLDSETGLMLYRKRYYNTKLGIFTNRDPISYKSLDINIYRYIFNNPNLSYDPFGLSALPNWTSGTWSFGGSIYKGVGGGLTIDISEIFEDCDNGSVKKIGDVRIHGEVGLGLQIMVRVAGMVLELGGTVATINVDVGGRCETGCYCPEIDPEPSIGCCRFCTDIGVNIPNFAVPIRSFGVSLIVGIEAYGEAKGSFRLCYNTGPDCSKEGLSLGFCGSIGFSTTINFGFISMSSGVNLASGCYALYGNQDALDF
jgi:RHS repeat-associated protein